MLYILFLIDWLPDRNTYIQTGKCEIITSAVAPGGRATTGNTTHHHCCCHSHKHSYHHHHLHHHSHQHSHHLHHHHYHCTIWRIIFTLFFYAEFHGAQRLFTHEKNLQCIFQPIQPTLLKFIYLSERDLNCDVISNFGICSIDWRAVLMKPYLMCPDHCCWNDSPYCTITWQLSPSLIMCWGIMDERLWRERLSVRYIIYACYLLDGLATLKDIFKGDEVLQARLALSRNVN